MKLLSLLNHCIYIKYIKMFILTALRTVALEYSNVRTFHFSKQFENNNRMTNHTKKKKL